MIIRCWGARGSIPVSGKDYLHYGGNTTCLEIRNHRDDILLVDAGSGIREAGNSFLADGRRDFTLLLTHAHWDHIMGFPFFKPLYRHDATINIWGCPFAQDSIREMLARVMFAPYFPIKYDDIHANVTYAEICIETYQLGDLTITPIALSHPNQGTGYKFSEAGRNFVFLTDNELGLQRFMTPNIWTRNIRKDAAGGIRPLSRQPALRWTPASSNSVFSIITRNASILKLTTWSP